MKLAIFALIAGLCVVIASASTDTFVPTQEIEEADYDLLAQLYAEENVEFENFGAFSGIYWVAKAGLRTLKGIHCTVKFVGQIKIGVLQFLKDVKSCGSALSPQVQTLVNQCQKIVTTSNNIIHMNSQICNNDVATSANQKITGWNCFWRMLGEIMSLQLQMFKVVQMAAKVPKVGASAAPCFSRAAIRLSGTFTKFPSFIRSCSKLTSN